MAKSIKTFYEEWHRSAADNRSQEIRDRDLIAIESLDECASVFELGCGSGVILDMLSASAKAGVDISQTAIRIAETTVQRAASKDLRVFDIDEGDLPWDDASFDGCLASEVLEHLFDPVHALAELNRILKLNGKCVVTVPNIGYFSYRYYHLVSGEVSDFHGNGLVVDEHIRYYSVRSLTKMMRLTGFGDIIVHGVMKLIVNTEKGSRAKHVPLTGMNLLKALRPTPFNILSKCNRLFRLWRRYPSLFAVGLVVEARKMQESKIKYNAAIDHQVRSSCEEKLHYSH